MPTMSEDMIAEIEKTIEDLVEEVNGLRAENTALKAQLLREKATEGS